MTDGTVEAADCLSGGREVLRERGGGKLGLGLLIYMCG